MSEQQRQWVLEICGDDYDLDVAASVWADPDHIKVSKFDDQGQKFFGITSSQFSTLSDARQVLEVGARLLGLVNGALFIRDTSRKPLTPARVHEQTPNGMWNRNIVVEAGHYELRGFAPILEVSGEPSKTPPYPAWTAAADSEDCVAEVLMYFRGEPEWFELYDAFEKMRDDLNRRYGQHNHTKAGWPAKLDDFTESAQVYRHSSAKWKRYSPETAPMTLKDAQSFVRNLAEIWLCHRAQMK